MKSKKGSLNLLIEFALFLAVLVIILVMLFTLTADTKTEFDSGSLGYNATVDTEKALSKIPSKLGILATAIIFSVILWVIMRVLPMKIGGQGGIGA